MTLYVTLLYVFVNTLIWLYAYSKADPDFRRYTTILVWFSLAVLAADVFLVLTQGRL